MLAEKDSKPIPVGWALDCDGNPTTDAGQAMRGTMLPIADEKGAALAFMIEILTAGLCDADFAFSASSLFDSKGPPPNLAQTFVLFNPISFNKERFAERIETLFTAILNQQNVRLPGERRFKSRRRAQKNGVNIPDAIYQDLSRRASL